MKRVISSSFIALLLIGLIGGGFFYFKKYRNKSDKAINAIPPDAAFFIDYYADAGNLKKLLSSNFISDSRNQPVFKHVISSMTAFDSLASASKSLHEILDEGHLLISVHVTKAADFDLLYLFSLPPGHSEEDCIEWVRLFAGAPQAELQSRNYDGMRIMELPLGGESSFTFTVSKGVFAGSFTSFLVEDAIRQQKLKKPFGGDRAFLALFEKESLRREDKIYIKYANLPKWLAVFTDQGKENSFSMIGDFAGWSCLSIHGEKEHISFQGTSEAADSNGFTGLFKRQLPVDIMLPSVLPAKTAAFLYYGISNPPDYFQDLKKYLDKNENGTEKDRYLNTLDAAYKTSIREKFQSWVGNEYAFVVTEPAGTNYDNNVLAFFSTRDTARAIKNLRQLSQLVHAKQPSRITEEKYNGHIIGLINLRDVMPALYGNVYKRLGKLFFTAIKGYVVFSNQASALRSYLDDFENRNFLFADEDKNILKKQSSNGNFCMYSRIPACQYIFKSIASDESISLLNQYKELSQWDGFSFLLKSNGNSCQSFAYLQYAQKPASGVNLVWAAELDTAVAAGPFFVPLGSDQKGVIVQDGQYNLYMLDNAGNVKWKKVMHEKIAGEVHAIDIFKNGQLQLVFNTDTTLEMLDADGNDMSGYPIRLPAPATNGSAVFDYDETNDYRIYVACSNGHVYGYQPGGKPLPGWNFNSPTGIVSQPLQHFKHAGQDYLVFSDDLGQVFIVSKLGDAIINVRQKLFKPEAIPFYLDEDKEGNYSFVTTDTSGSICSIMPDGFIRVHPVMEYGGAQGFAMADMDHDDENDFLFNDGNQLSLYLDDSISLFSKIPGGEAETSLVLFSAKGGDLKIGTWSEKTDRLYLFNSDGSIYKGFPVKGGRRFYLDEINNDGRKNILSSSGREVLLYVLE